MFDWYNRLPDRTRAFAALAGILMGAFSSQMPERFQFAGLLVGYTLGFIFLVDLMLHRAKEWRGGKTMSPQDLILVGIIGIFLSSAMTLGGFAWQNYSRSDTSSELPIVVTNKKSMTIDGLDNLSSVTPTVQTEGQISPKRFLSTADKERISEALIAISKINSTVVNKLFWDAEKLYVPWHNLSPQIDAEFAKRSLAESRRLSSELKDVQASIYDNIVKEYEDYSTDLKDVLLHGKMDGIHPLNRLALALDNFGNALQNYIELAEKYQIGSEDKQKLAKLVWSTSEELRWGVTETVGWSEFMKDRIKKKKESLSQ